MDEQTSIKDHVVLTRDWENRCIRLLTGPMTKQEAHARVRELIYGPGIVAWAEDRGAVILPEDGSDVVRWHLEQSKGEQDE